MIRGKMSNATNTVSAISSSSIVEVWAGLFGLTLVVLVVAALLVWYRKYLIKNGGSGDPIQVLHIKPLGARDRLLVVRIEDRILVLGQTPNQITFLTELESFSSGAGLTGAGVFAGQLQKWVTSRKSET